MEDKISPMDALSVNLWVLRLTGAWVAGISSRKMRLIYNAYGAVLLSVMSFVYFSTEIVYVTMIWGDLEAMSEISLVLLTHVANAVKLLNFLIRRKRIEKLLIDSCQDKFMPKNRTQLGFLRSAIREANWSNVVFVSMCVATVTGWAIAPLVDNSQRRLPLKTWFPFDTKKSPTYEAIYAYQIIAITINACMNAMMDTFVAMLMSLVVVQIDILRYDISNMENVGNQNVGVKSISVGAQELMRKNKVEHKLEEGGAVAVGLAKEFPPSSSQQRDDILHERIVGCIKHHGAIIRFGSEIQDTFGIGISVQFAVSSAILCLTCFEMTLISPASLQFGSLILYQGCMLAELYCYCWYGNGLIVKTSDLMTVAFHSPWTTSSPRFKKSLILMMCRMQQPMQLMIAGLFGLSLETFSMVIRTAYSFYAVVQRFHSEG